MSTYATLAGVNVNEHKAKKGGFDYLSWADAVDILQQHYPEATWSVREWDGLPFVSVASGTWVCVTVTVDGLERTQWHPVLNHQNRTIQADKLDAFAINTSIQRALAKAIALHGLGLYIFRGEDFPADEGTDKGSTPNVEPRASQAPQDRHAAGLAAVKQAAVEKGIADDSLAAYCKHQYSAQEVKYCNVDQLADCWKAINTGKVTEWLNAQVPE